VREIERQAEQVAGLAQRARQSLTSTLERAGDDIAHTRARLLALSPAATLRRGYAIVQRADSAVVRAASEVCPGERLAVRFAQDQLIVSAAATGENDHG
jgi:exodeoxyribonuclease VII large subunit